MASDPVVRSVKEWRDFAKRVEHYEIAGYGSACALARSMQRKGILELLEKTLAEEESTDTLLTTLGDELIAGLVERAQIGDMGLEVEEVEEPKASRAR